MKGQWLGLHASNAGGAGSIPGQGTKIPHARWQGPQNVCVWGAWLGMCNQSLSKVLTIPEAGWGQGHDDSLKREINKSKDMNLIKSLIVFIFPQVFKPISIFTYVSQVGKKLLSGGPDRHHSNTELKQPLTGLGFPGGSAGRKSACSAAVLGSIPGLGRSPGEGKDYPLQYSGLEKSMD